MPKNAITDTMVGRVWIDLVSDFEARLVRGWGMIDSNSFSTNGRMTIDLSAFIILLARVKLVSTKLEKPAIT